MAFLAFVYVPNSSPYTSPFISCSATPATTNTSNCLSIVAVLLRKCARPRQPIQQRTVKVFKLRTIYTFSVFLYIEQTQSRAMCFYTVLPQRPSAIVTGKNIFSSTIVFRVLPHGLPTRRVSGAGNHFPVMCF